IIFDRLTEEDLKKIVEIQLGSLTKRLAQQNITLDLTDRAKALIACEGYDPVYGARPLKQAIQRDILDPLSMNLLEDRFREGQSILADAKDGTIECKTR